MNSENASAIGYTSLQAGLMSQQQLRGPGDPKGDTTVANVTRRLGELQSRFGQLVVEARSIADRAMGAMPDGTTAAARGQDNRVEMVQPASDALHNRISRLEEIGEMLAQQLTRLESFV